MNLLRACFKAITINSKQLNNHWVKKNQEGFWLSRSSYSMRLIARFRFEESKKKRINVWIPSYFCNESLDEIRKEKVRIYFYPIMENGIPDLRACKKQMTVKNAPDLFFGVHYFGREIDFKEISEFAESFDAWFVEDAAHVLRRSGKIGKYSHFTFFSPHKMLAIPDGSILVFNKDNFFESKKSLERFKKLYQEINVKNFKANVFLIKWVLKRTIQKLGYRRSTYNNLEIFDDNEIKNSSQNLISRMSKFSKKLIMLEKSLESEINTRNENYNFWRNFFKKNNLVGDEIFSNHNLYCPYLFGFKLKDRKQMLKALNLLNKYSIPALSWPDLPKEVYEEETRYKSAIELKRNTLFLPIHSSIKAKSMNKYLS
tara:strand:- start:12268 stop:13380 length:1113 start_codon:yes stop_codon:yes gene_type:complete